MHGRICSRSESSYMKWRQVRCRFVGKVLELYFTPSWNDNQFLRCG